MRNAIVHRPTLSTTTRYEFAAPPQQSDSSRCGRYHDNPHVHAVPEPDGFGLNSITCDGPPTPCVTNLSGDVMLYTGKARSAVVRRNSFWRLVERSGHAIPVVVQSLYVVLAAALSLYVISPTPALAQSATVALRNVSVVDTRDGSIHPNQTVLVDRNHISAVGNASEVTIPVNAEIVDGGGYVIPGLWDMHVHSVADLAGDGSNASVATHEWHFPMFLAHGVTGIRNMNDGTADVTLELTQSVRRRLAEGDLLGPARFITAGPSVDGDPPLASNPLVVRTAAEARSAVEQLAANGADLIKVYENLSREAYFAVMDEARRRGIPVDGHVPFRVTLEEAADAGQRTVEHPEVLALGCSTEAEAERERFARVLADYDSLTESEQFLVQFRHYRALYDTYDRAACGSAIEAFRRNGVAVTADLLAYHDAVHEDEVLADETSMRLVPPAIRRDWQELMVSDMAQEFQSIMRPVLPLELENVRLLNEAGVILLAATDVGVPMQIPGFGLHRELGMLVEAGLTPLEALQTATLNPARVLGFEDSLGTVEAGKLADLVVLGGNPLEDITKTQTIQAVIADGRLYRRIDLDQLLSDVQMSGETRHE